MIIEDILIERGMTLEELAMQTNIPLSVLEDLCSGHRRLEKCTTDLVYRLAKTLHVTMERLTEAALLQSVRERNYESDLPPYLQADLEAYKNGIRWQSSMMDCLWMELYSSIHLAEITEEVITAENAQYLRQKYLFGKGD